MRPSAEPFAGNALALLGPAVEENKGSDQERRNRRDDHGPKLVSALHVQDRGLLSVVDLAEGFVVLLPVFRLLLVQLAIEVARGYRDSFRRGVLVELFLLDL